MKAVASTDEYTIYLKRNGRHAVRNAERQWINGDEKVAILLEHKLITAPEPKAPEPEAEVEAEADAEGSEEAAADDAEAAEE